MLVAVTGNFAVGKSAFLRSLKRLGFEVLDIDRFVAKVYETKEMIEWVKGEIGSTIALNDVVDRKLLAVIIFNDARKLKKLREKLYPIVTERIKEIGHSNEIVFVEVPLLFEADMAGLFDKVVLLTASQETAISRAQKKGFTEEEYLSRIRFQIPQEEKIPKADFVVDSEGPVNKLAYQAGVIAKKLREEAEK